MPVEEQVVSIYAGTKGYLDKLPVNKVGEFERKLIADLKTRAPDVLNSIRETREMKPDIEKKLTEMLESVSKSIT